MLPDLEAFLTHYTPMTKEREVWGRAQLAFHVTSYLGCDLPPLEWVTSVRSLVFREDSVLVVRDPERQHFLPGGRREQGETLTETLRRELLEETGWTIHDPCLLGWRHYHHLSPKPPGYRYPYPDFLQLVYTAEAAQLRPSARQTDGDEIEAVFHPIAVVQALVLSPAQHLYLEAALRARPCPQPTLFPSEKRRSRMKNQTE